MTMAETITKAVPSRGCLHVSSPEARLSDRSLRIPSVQGDDFTLNVPKSVPQRLKPSSAQVFTARLKPCPSLKFADYL
jgi:hypothetical protein